MSVTIEAIKLPESGPLHLELNLTTHIAFTAEEARRKVSVYVGNHIADLLSGETPTLVWRQEKAFWRVPVKLSSRAWGRIGLVGALDVDVQTGELQIDEQAMQEIEENAGRFAASAAL